MGAYANTPAQDRLARPPWRSQASASSAASSRSVDPLERDRHRGEPPAPPDLRIELRVARDVGADAVLIDHHVHVPLVPQRREDAPADAEGRASVVVLLVRAGQRERERAGFVG